MLFQLPRGFGVSAQSVYELAHRPRVAHCQALGNPIVCHRRPALDQRGTDHLPGIAFPELHQFLPFRGKPQLLGENRDNPLGFALAMLAYGVARVAAFPRNPVRCLVKQSQQLVLESLLSPIPIPAQGLHGLFMDLSSMLRRPRLQPRKVGRSSPAVLAQPEGRQHPFHRLPRRRIPLGVMAQAAPRIIRQLAMDSTCQSGPPRIRPRSYGSLMLCGNWR